MPAIQTLTIGWPADHRLSLAPTSASASAHRNWRDGAAAPDRARLLLELLAMLVLPPRVIDKVTMEQAVSIARLLVEHTLAVRQLMGGDAATEDAKVLYDWIVREEQARFTRTDCLRPYHGRFTQKKRLDAALDVLSQRRIVGRHEREQTGRPGRPAEVYEVNPLVFDRK